MRIWTRKSASIQPRTSRGKSDGSWLILDACSCPARRRRSPSPGVCATSRNRLPSADLPRRERIWNLSTYLFPDEAPAIADRLCDGLDLGVAAGDEAEPYLVELCRAADKAWREHDEQTWRFSAGPSGARSVPIRTGVVLGALGQRQHQLGERRGLYPRENLAYVPDCWACGTPMGRE